MTTKKIDTFLTNFVLKKFVGFIEITEAFLWKLQRKKIITIGEKKQNNNNKVGNGRRKYKILIKKS